MDCASKECLLYGPVDNCLSHRSFNGQPCPELDKDFLSRVWLCSDSANEIGRVSLMLSRFAIMGPIT